MTLKLFLKGILADLSLGPLLGIHLLQTRVFSFKLFEPLNRLGIHVTILGKPLIQCRSAHVVLPRQLRNRHPSFQLLQNRHDLTVRKP